MKNTSSDRVGVAGFCVGGPLAIRGLETLSDRITATVGFYPGSSSGERHGSCWGRYAGKESIIHCAEGENRTSLAPGIQEALREINGAGGKAVACDYRRTNLTGHLFNDDRPEVFNESAAKLAWARTINFFAQKLSE
jgi:carboxymethylenebutenolidase